jgi:hypothetical protein
MFLDSNTGKEKNFTTLVVQKGVWNGVCGPPLACICFLDHLSKTCGQKDLIDLSQSTLASEAEGGSTPLKTQHWQVWGPIRK